MVADRHHALHVFNAATAQRPSDASRTTRTVRTAAFFNKHGVMPPLPHYWTQKELTLQQLVDLGQLSAAEAAEEAGAATPAAAAPAGDDEAQAAAPAPDLSAHKPGAIGSEKCYRNVSRHTYACFERHQLVPLVRHGGRIIL